MIGKNTALWQAVIVFSGMVGHSRNNRSVTNTSLVFLFANYLTFTFIQLRLDPDVG